MGREGRGHCKAVYLSREASSSTTTTPYYYSLGVRTSVCLRRGCQYGGVVWLPVSDPSRFLSSSWDQLTGLPVTQ